MTGEMIKPENADKGEEYWRSKRGVFGYSVIGDEAYLIRPNYPEFFELRDKIRKIGFKEADVEPFDVYNGPYIDLKGIDVGKTPERGALSLNLSKLVNSCQIWKDYDDLWKLDCGKNNKKLFGTDEPYMGDSTEILDKLKDIRDKLG